MSFNLSFVFMGHFLKVKSRLYKESSKLNSKNFNKSKQKRLKEKNSKIKMDKDMNRHFKEGI